METELNEIEIPKKIKQASLLVYVSLIVGLLKSALYETMTNQKILSDPKSLTIAIVTILIIGFLGYKIGQGKNWARITLLILFVIGMLGFPFVILNEFQMSPIIGIVSIAQMLIQLYVLVILFSGQSKEWFRRQKIKTTPNNG
jgi:preprotein translocase subunit Sss1